MTPLQKVQAVYAGCDADSHRTIHTAVSAVMDGRCSTPVVVTGVSNLVAHYEDKAELPDIERAERYLIECWTEHKATGGQEP